MKKGTSFQKEKTNLKRKEKSKEKQEKQGKACLPDAGMAHLVKMRKEAPLGSAQQCQRIAISSSTITMRPGIFIHIKHEGSTRDYGHGL